MPSAPDPNEDPGLTGVPSDTPAAVRPSATGLVTGPIEGETDVEVGDLDAAGEETEAASASLDRTLQDAEGGVEGSTLDAPDE